MLLCQHHSVRFVSSLYSTLVTLYLTFSTLSRLLAASPRVSGLWGYKPATSSALYLVSILVRRISGCYVVWEVKRIHQSVVEYDVVFKYTVYEAMFLQPRGQGRVPDNLTGSYHEGFKARGKGGVVDIHFLKFERLHSRGNAHVAQVRTFAHA